MGLLGSALGRGLAGAGAGLSEIANKYIDNEVLIQRAQAIADINRTSAVQQLKDTDTYQNSDERRTRLRGQAAADEEAIGTARNKVGLAGRVAEATNAELLNADVTRTSKITRAQADATAAAATSAEKNRGLDPDYIKAEKALTAARESPSSKIAAAAAAEASRAHTELLKLQTSIAKSTNDLQEQLRVAVVTGDKGAEEQYRAELAVLQGKPGQKETAAHAIAEAQKAMAPAMKIIGDSMSSPQAIDIARQTIAEQSGVIKHYNDKLGIQPIFPSAPPAAIVELKKDPSPQAMAEFDHHFGPGAAAKLLPTAVPAAGARAERVAAAPAQATTTNPTPVVSAPSAQQRISEIERTLAASGKPINEGAPLLDRMMQGTAPLGIAQRRSLEIELAALKGVR